MIVTEKAQRPIKMNGTCCYCSQPIGTEHKPDCVLIKKRVRVRMTIEYEVEVPAFWEKEQVEFHRNDSSWCGDNALAELDRLAHDGNLKPNYFCENVSFEYLETTSEPFLDE